MNCGRCNNSIEQERLDALGGKTSICAACARMLNPPKVRGRVVYFHKTAPEIEIMSEETFKATEKYYPKFGRGSGVHAMSRSTSSL